MLTHAFLHANLWCTSTQWASGERYDGEWMGGHEEGIGVFSWPDGATYQGFWKGGKKHGLGVLRPKPGGRVGAKGREQGAGRRGQADSDGEAPPLTTPRCDGLGAHTDKLKHCLLCLRP